MAKKFYFFILCSISFFNFCFSQTITIDNYSINGLGQVQLSIQDYLNDLILRLTNRH